MSTAGVEIAIVGAGVIGLAIAQRLAAEGHEVVVIDPNPPGSGSSYGNAGTVADYAVQPVGTPDVLRNLPSLLFDRDSPLSIRRAALPTLAPWLLRFARQSLPGAARRNAVSIAGMMEGAAPAWEGLAAQVGGSDLIRRKGCLYLYETRAARRGAESDLAFRRTMGVKVDLIDADALAKMEPALPRMDGGAAFFPGAIFLTDPGQMMTKLAAGILQITGKVDRLVRQTGGVRLTGPGVDVTAARVVIAAGAHSRALAAQAGSRVPLETERGYHLEWDGESDRVSRPSCPTSRGFYLCPMAGRLRVAGTVELGGVTAPPSPHRIAKLLEGAQALFPDLGTPDREWLGFRPSMPDSLPVIGATGGGEDVILAFGHGHVGLTMAPKTAEIVADLVAGRQADTAALPCHPARF